MNIKNFYFFGSYNSFRPFIMEIESGNDNKFTIPTTGVDYNYDVKTSDGQTFTGQTGNLTITFPNPNTRYDVEISGDFPRFYFNNGSERLKIKDIKQWGDIVWGVNQNQSYYGASNVTCTATDTLDMTLVANGQSMFYQATNFNPPNFAPTLANLTNGSYMFYLATSFNPPNFSPTLANLTNGSYMFRQASAFNPSNFAPTLANLTNAYQMFYQATNFNPPNFAPTLANLTNGSYMFYQATSFAQDIYAPNSIYLVDDTQMFNGTKIAKITMNNTALTTSHPNTFNCTLLTDLILTDRKVDLRISYSPLLTSAKIDALANSVADMTGFASPSVTMTLAQRASCDQSLWANKNWTIIAV